MKCTQVGESFGIAAPDSPQQIFGLVADLFEIGTNGK
jgi:hypothetical protein